MAGRNEAATVSPIMKGGAALFYGVSSFSIMFINKIVLSIYQFPSFGFLAASQFLFTSVVILALKAAGKVQVTPLSCEVLRVMSPLIIISLINVLSGLGGTQKLNLPMFTVLRRFSILLTMVFEAYALGTTPSKAVRWSVFLMIFGAFVAAISDLAFDLEGYLMIAVSDVFTALNGVVMKRTLVACPAINKMGVLFHNSWTGAVIMAGLLMLKSDELEKVKAFEHWGNPDFLISFFLASAMGSILNYSIFLCTLYNSALTTTVVGCLKNVLTTYIGMIFLPDYVFTWQNFMGLNVSIFGSLLYSYNELKEIMKPKPAAGMGMGVDGGGRRKGHRAVNISISSGANSGGGGGSKREAELVRLLGEQRPPSGGGRPEGADHGGEVEGGGGATTALV